MKIILLSYINRSGSTYLVNQLSKIPTICVCPEADILYELLLSYSNFKIKQHHLNKWKSLFESDPKFKSWKLPVESIINANIVGENSYVLFINILIKFQKRYFPNCDTIIYKQNFLYKIFNEIKSISENIFFGISLIRSPLGIYNSQKHTINPQLCKIMSKNPLQLIKEWNNFIKTDYSMTDNYTVVIYEKLITEFEESMDNILQFLKISGPFQKYTFSEATHINWIDLNHIPIHQNINKTPVIGNIIKWKEGLNNAEYLVIKLNYVNNKYYKINEGAKHLTLGIIFYYLYCLFLKIQHSTIKTLHKIVFWIKNY